MPRLLEIAIPYKEPRFKIRTILEGVQVVLYFDWNERDSRWQLSISDSSQNPILMSCPMNINEELISRFSIATLPPGRLMLWDSSKKNIEAGINDLGDRCRLLYQESV